MIEHLIKIRVNFHITFSLIPLFIILFSIYLSSPLFSSPLHFSFLLSSHLFFSSLLISSYSILFYPLLFCSVLFFSLFFTSLLSSPLYYTSLRSSHLLFCSTLVSQVPGLSPVTAIAEGAVQDPSGKRATTSPKGQEIQKRRKEIQKEKRNTIKVWIYCFNNCKNTIKIAEYNFSCTIVFCKNSYRISYQS